MDSVENWRKAQGWTQAQLGEKLGKAQRTVSGIEAGGAVTPELERALRALGYSGPLKKARPELSDILDETEKVMAELKRRGFKPATKDDGHELRKLVADEVRDSHALGRAESVVDRVERWIRIAGQQK